MGRSRNYDELRHTWEQWREVTGRVMRDDFIEFVKLSNKAASLDGKFSLLKTIFYEDFSIIVKRY